MKGYDEKFFTTPFEPLKNNHVCERCGGIRPAHTKTNFHINGREFRDIGWIRLCAGSGYERDIDLCENCMKELAEWMEELRYIIGIDLSSQPSIS